MPYVSAQLSNSRFEEVRGLDAQAIVTSMLTRVLSETIRIVNITSDTLAQFVAQGSGYERTSNGTRLTSTDMTRTSFPRNYFDAQTSTVRLRERHTLGKITSHDMCSVVRGPSLHRIQQEVELKAIRPISAPKTTSRAGKRPTCSLVRHTERSWRAPICIDHSLRIHRDHPDTHMYLADRSPCDRT